MKFSQLATILAEVEAVSSRLAITEKLATLWQQLPVEEARATANLIQGQLLPAYEGLEFNLSEKMVARALVKYLVANGGLPGDGVAVDIFGQADEASLLTTVKKLHHQTGDYGQTAAAIHQQLSPQVDHDLTINQVYEQLLIIARENGTGSQERKLELLVNLYCQLDAVSMKLMTRIVIGKLRLGFSLMTILDSLSWAGTASKIETKELEEIYQKKADIGRLVESYLSLLAQSSAARLTELRARYQLEVGVPLVPALCQRLNSSQDIIDKMTTVIAEPKYDGMRIQIHLRRVAGQLRVAAFTRSLENVSAMFPELEKLAASLKVDSLVLDSEAVGYDVESGNMLPFQETMTRRRKHNIDQKAAALPIKFFVFDILELNGQDLLATPLVERKQILAANVQDSQVVKIAPFITTNDAQKLHDYHHTQLAAGLEGMVAKGEHSAYQPGRKGWQWVKIKEEEGTRGKLNDTLDLVVMGVYAGRGKRHDFGVGAFLVGLLTSDGNLVTISKIGTGLSDDQFRDLKQKTDQLKVESKPINYQVNKTLTPDIWLSPQLVAEIAADEITKSTIHTSGFGLRFPRLIRWRTDKTADQATDTEQLKQIKIA